MIEKLDKIAKHWAQRKPLVWDTISTTFLSTVGKGVGFLVPFFIAAWFGVSQKTDAFFFAYGLALFLANVFSNVLASITVPFFAEMEDQSRDLQQFTASLMSIGGIIVTLVLGSFLLVSPLFLPFILHLPTEGLHLVNVLLREISPLIILLTWTGILSGALNTQKSFAIPAISPAFRATITLVFIFLFRKPLGIHSIAYGYVLGELIRVLTLFFWAHRKGLVPAFPFRASLDSHMKEFLKTASYQSLAMITSGLKPVVDKTMASWLPVGSLSVLHYADRMYTIPVIFFSSGLMVTILSHWSHRYLNEGSEQLKRDLHKAVKIVALSSLAIIIIFIVFSNPLTKLALYHGAFAKERVSQARLVWICYLLGLPFQLLGILYGRAHSVLKETVVLLKRALLINILNIGFNYILMQYIGVAGIALASSITAVISVLYVSFAFYKNLSSSKREAVF